MAKEKIDQNLILKVQDHLKCIDMENFMPS